MEEIAGQLRKRGIDSRVFAGGDADLALLAGLIAHARIWIGNDTGPAHLAQAYGIPGVVVFGGGHWPAYAPWGRGVIGFVHPLPCFGCEWSCAFGHGICVESIPPTAVCDGFAEARANPGQPAKVEALDRVPANSLKIIGEAAAAFRATELDRRSLFSATVEMEYRQARTDEAAARIAAEVAATKEEWLRQPLDPEFLLQVLGARDVDIRGLRAEVDNQRKTIIELDRAAAERLVQMLAAIERENAIELEARKRASAIDDLHEMISVRELRIAELESTADERLQLIHKAEKQWKDAAAEAVRQGRAAAERLSLIESTAAQLRAVTHEAEERLAKLQSSEEQNKSLAAEAATHAKTAQERLELIESIDAQLKSVTEAANERLSMLQTADEQNRDLATEAATHAKAARERLELIETIDAQLKSVTAAANERARDVDELTRIAEERLSLLRAAEQQLANVTAESQDRAIAIDELRQLLSERDEELQSQRATSEGLSARLAVTESNESRLQREVEQFRAETLLDMIKRSLHSIRK